jgi:Fungal chitosanase of glycosyl hydrolase group 75
VQRFFPRPEIGIALRVIFAALFFGWSAFVNAGVTLTTPNVAGGEYVNGVTFSVNVTSDIAKVDLSANGFAFGTLNAANNWSLRYTFSNLGTRDIAAKGFDASGVLVSSATITINVVDVSIANPAVNSEYLNATPIAVAASDRIAQVVLRAETFEIGRSGTRDGAGRFVINPAVIGTIGARTFNFDALLANGSIAATKSIPVTVINVTLLTPTEGASFLSNEVFSAQSKAVVSAARVEYFADGVSLGSISDATTLWKRDITLVNTGTRVIKAVAYNASGVKLGEDAANISIGSNTPTCQFGPWSAYNGLNLRRHANGAYLYKTSHKQIDADGAPNAYHPADVGKLCSATAGLKGLDCPANAGYPNGSFWRDVLALDPNNNAKPYVQVSGPFAGYFVSMTSLSDQSKAATDPNRYVSSTTVPYIVFPGNFNAKSGTGKVGDLGFAINLSNNKKSHFVVAETGPAAADLGEMSIFLATAMGGVNPNPINGAGAPSGTILYVSFPFSSNAYAWPMTNPQMQTNVYTLLQSVGGEAGILACQGLL